MNLQHQARGPQQQITAPPSITLGPASPPSGAGQPTTPSGGVTVLHGIHRGFYPVAGLRVRQARQILSRLFRLDPAAVAVSHGRILDEDDIIDESIALLNFVPPSAVKG